MSYSSSQLPSLSRTGDGPVLSVALSCSTHHSHQKKTHHRHASKSLQEIRLRWRIRKASLEIRL